MRRWVRNGLLGAVLVPVAVVASLYRPDLDPHDLEAEYATPPSRFVEVDGLRVHVRESGAGPALVLVHGSNGHLLGWEPWRAELDRDLRVVAVDLPGHGLTGPDPQERYRPRDQVAFLHRLTEVLGLERFHLAGHSMGGGIAWRYTLAHPDRVDRLVLVAAVGYPLEQAGGSRAARLARVPVVGALATKLTPRSLVERLLRDAYGVPGALTDDAVDAYYAMLRREGNRDATRRRYLQRPEHGQDADRITEIDRPTLVLWGEQDTWVPFELAGRFAEDIEGARLVTYPGVGHVPAQELPRRTAADVRSFLSP
jgi:pimeloyl-ACP methyl ester carboxylesterase